MPSWQARLVARLVRWRVKPALGDMRDIARVRRAFGQTVPPPRGARFTPATVAGVPGEWVEPAEGPRPTDTLLYLHGGGFIGCSPRTHRPATAGLALRGWRVFVPDYRLAPEHPYPAALDDCRAVWRALVAEQAAGQAGQPAPAHGTASASATSGATSPAPSSAPGRLTVAGDSAGGNLCLALMLAERDEGGRLPDAAALFSPATDLTGGSASIRDNAERDAMFQGEALGHLADAYLQGADPAQPLVSPLLGRLDGLPPLLLHVGEDECLRDDALRLAVRARAAGVTVALQVWSTVPHVWQLIRWLPEARASLDIAARFLRAPQAVAGAQPQDEVLDALIVGAGLSGIGQAAHLQQACPEQRYAILEARPRLGGTWDLFRYPGVRSDSDMYTLGYAFKPWTNAKAIADGPSIKAYIAETARERGIDAQIRYGHRAVAADWSSAEARWRVTVEVTPPEPDAAAAPDRSHAGTDSGPGPGPGPAPTSRTIHTRFLLMCGGYYRYAQGHRPEWPGEADFRGRLVHPQAWPEDLDYSGKQVVIIGSGATAVTLLPEMAKDAAHVVMLQRSPTYIVTLPGQDPVAHWLRRQLGTVLGPMAQYRLVRLKNIVLGMLLFQLARRWPDKAQARLLGLARQQLPPGADIARDYTPRYKPWDQRVCAVPDGDLFQAVRAGRASVVTDTIERFTPEGIRLASGRELPADIVVTATGLELNALGDMAITVDGQPLAPASTMAYKGMMFSGVPNLVQTFGYTNASWTLKADLTADFTCRLIRHMARHGHAAATPQRDPSVGEAPFLDFSSGYVQRALPTLPKQGDRKPWRLYQNYLLDWLTLRWGRVDDGHLQFTPAPPDRR